MIGALKHRVALQQAVRSADGGGGFTETWQNLATAPEVYAAIVPLSGGEQLRFHQLEAAVTHRITIRYRTDITPAMRIVKDGTVYDIISALDRNGEGIYLEILAAVRFP
jgi:SPP1 family predicted phage head-tail adaptor